MQAKQHGRSYIVPWVWDDLTAQMMSALLLWHYLIYSLCTARCFFHIIYCISFSILSFLNNFSFRFSENQSKVEKANVLNRYKAYGSFKKNLHYEIQSMTNATFDQGRTDVAFPPKFERYLPVDLLKNIWIYIRFDLIYNMGTDDLGNYLFGRH